jgi:hypothetical protein
MPVRRMVRVVEASERLVVEFPWAARNRAAFKEAFDVDAAGVGWTVTRAGTTPVASGTLGAAMRIDVDLSAVPSGLLELRLQAQGRELWRQWIFSQHTLARTPEEIDALANRWAPVLLFSSREEYFPLGLESLVDAPEVKASRDSIKVKTVFGDERIPLPELSEFLRYNGHADYLLDQSAFDSQKVFDRVHGDFQHACLYYSWIEEGGTGFLNFHTFYAFDPKTGIAKLLGVGPHVFDRESLTFVFPPGSDAPSALVLSAHLEGQTILYLDSLKLWTHGRVKMPLPDPRVADVRGHVVVPVAEGSHALYPAPGHYHISVLTELAGHVLGSFASLLGIEGDHEDALQTHQVLLPPDIRSSRFSSYALRPLRLDLLRSEPHPPRPLYDPSTSVLAFSGFWVDVPGLQNERFPPFSSRETAPTAWTDKAYEWDWDKLPEAVVAHNRDIAARIAAEVSEESSRPNGPAART